jgi:acyl carrier protein
LPIKNLQTPTVYDRPELAIDYSAPENDLEKELTDIWQDFLKITPIGIHDNFFDLGGHSLLAAQLIRHIKDHLSVNLDLGVFFSAPTIAELSSILETQLQESSEKQMEKYLAEIENMTEEEVKSYLEKL